MITTNKLIHPCAIVTGVDDASVNVAYAVASMLLFDSYIIKSHRLCELPVLMGVFGPDGMKTLQANRMKKLNKLSRNTG